MSYFIAWLLPMFAGICVYAAFATQRKVGGWIGAALGYGAVFGLLLASASTALSARADTAHAWTHAVWWLALVALGAAALAWWRMRTTPSLSRSERTNVGSESIGVDGIPRWQSAVLIALLASLVVRAAIAAREIWLRPTYPWDAWSAWAVKAKTWFLLGHYVPYASMHDWMLQAPGADLYTGVAWHYPNALGWIEVWFASAAGGWIEPLVNLPWLAVWMALLFAHYGQWRALGLARSRALFFVYVLGSLPLLSVHAAIAGYADIWVAALFGFAVLAWMRWLQQRDLSQLLLALACAAVLPLLKLEGIVWASCLFAAIAFGALPSRWRWRSLIAVAIALLVLVIGGGVKPLFALLGWTDQTSPLALVLTPVWNGEAAVGIARTLFAQPNWHLLWWLALPAILWRWRELVAHDWLWLPGLLLLLCCGLLLYLFLLTNASSWAQSLTAINRLVLHIAPALVTFLALLLRDARLPEDSLCTAVRE